MSDLAHFNRLVSEWSFLSIPVGVFIASVLGSSHCVSMCGPIAITVNNESGYLGFYHLGRLLSYLILGALAGSFGGALLSSKYQIVSISSAVLISVFFIFTGYRLIRQKPLDLFFFKKLSPLLFTTARWARAQKPALKSLTIGAINGFLPCGWLYVFVLGSIATKEPLYSAVLLAVFWLGTVPALTIFPIFYRRVLGRLPRRLNQIAGVILVVVGLVNVLLIVLTRVMPVTHSIHNIHHH